MLTIDNILNKNYITPIKDIIDEEIKTSLCHSVPYYQSYNNMHIKYKDNKYIDALINKVTVEIKNLTNEKLSTNSCWFNVCKQDSKFEFHTHENTYLTTVYFLKNCENNGTIFKINNSLLQLCCKDNNLVIFDPKIIHKIPNWDGKNRYTIAIDFNK